jgi:hypothetical protein
MLGRNAGELQGQWLKHESGEAHVFYRGLLGPVCVGIKVSAFEESAGGFDLIHVGFGQLAAVRKTS